MVMVMVMVMATMVIMDIILATMMGMDTATGTPMATMHTSTLIPVTIDNATAGKYKTIPIRANCRQINITLPKHRTKTLKRISRYSYAVVTFSRR